MVHAEDLDTSAELASWDVVVLGDSGYSTADWADFEVELEAWITGGGGLVVAGYGARATVCSLAPGVAAMLPVDCDETVGDEESLTVVDAAHPVSDEVWDFTLDPATYMDTASTLANGGVGLMSSADGDWGVAVRDHGAGRVVYLAPVYMAASAGNPTPLRTGEADLLLEEAVAWAAGCVDVDGDGDDDLHCGGGDCDEDDPTRYAGAPELCNAIDDDCDGAVPLIELDGDGDGLAECEGDCDDADPAMNLDDLDQDGYDTCELDCDDTDAALNLDDLDADGFSTCDADCDDGDGTLTPADLDGDGYSTCTGDCDDGSGDRYPGNAEVCDGADNDCDGWTPIEELDGDGDGSSSCMGDCDDANPWFNGNDADGDGYSTCDDDCDDTEAALHPDDGDGDGQSPCDGDCDDADPDRYFEAPEVCNGIDDDCDGELPTDEEDADGDGTSACGGDCDDGDPARNIDDADGDGYDTCGSSGGETDCDDGDPGVNPGAAELCDNGVDDDCDGGVDDLPECFEPDDVGDDDDFALQQPGDCSCSAAPGDGNATAATAAGLLVGVLGLARRRLPRR